MSAFCWMLSVREMTPAVVRLGVLVPMNTWSYSSATDQFGAKPISTPVPIVPPQRVSLAPSSRVLVAVR